MLKFVLIGLATTLALLLTGPAFASDTRVAPPPPPKPATLDVTMTVVPLNADIEKTVSQTISIPMPTVAAGVQKPAAIAHATTHQQDKTGIKNIENTRASTLRQTAEAQREAAEAAKEAHKDSHNSGAPDNDTPP